MGVNNFKKLEDLEMENVSVKSDLIKSNIGANLGSLRFITNIVELYFPMIVNLFVGLTGGEPGGFEKKESNNKYPDMQ